ncbi:hypothetical protein CR513_49231, partial [Mucuna pruriens]
MDHLKNWIWSKNNVFKIKNPKIYQQHQWSSGRIVPCHGTDPGSIPGWCIPAGIAQLGERQTEDLKVTGPHGFGPF